MFAPASLTDFEKELKVNGWYPIYRCPGFPAIKAELISLYVNRV